MVRFFTPLLVLLPLTACGTGTLDMAGYPDASKERLYRDGRLGGDNGLLSFDARKVWHAVSGDTSAPGSQ
jgi:hypothetical protein